MHQLVERLPSDHFQHAAQHVEAHRVVPLGAWLEEQRQLRQVVAHLFQVGAGHAPLEARQAVEVVDGVAVHEAVGEARGVGEQLPETHGLCDRLQHRRVHAAGSPHLGVLERGDVMVHRVVQLEQSFLPQLQCEHRGDRFGHREDAPDGVGLNGQPDGEVALASDGVVHNLAVASYRDLPATEPPIIDVTLKVLIDSTQSLARHANRFGCCILRKCCHARTLATQVPRAPYRGARPVPTRFTSTLSNTSSSTSTLLRDAQPSIHNHHGRRPGVGQGGLLLVHAYRDT